MASVTPFVRGEAAIGTPGQLSAGFTLAGAGAVTDVRGNITAVRRLVTGTANVFYRATLNFAGQVPSPQVCVVTAIPSAEAQDLTATVEEVLVASPADVKGTNEIDISVRNAGLYVDTAGIQVRLLMYVKV